jgi:hypothetical protein
MKAWENEPNPLKDLNNILKEGEETFSFKREHEYNKLLEKIMNETKDKPVICCNCKKGIDIGQEKIFHPMLAWWYCKDCWDNLIQYLIMDDEE